MENSSGLKYFVGVDGSDMAHEAFCLALYNLIHGSDHINVAHVFNKAKTYLPFNMKPENIRQYYEALLISYPGKQILTKFSGKA
jgi:hypothetical protein